MSEKEFPKRRNSLRYVGGDYSLPGGDYFITICVTSAIDLTDNKISKKIIETIDFIDADGHGKFNCYVIMPDHIHAIIEIVSGRKSLSDIVWSFKRAVTGKLGYPGGTLWQRSYYDRVIRDYREYKKIVGYIAENPFRSGLVKKGEDYKLMRINYP